MLEVSRRIDPPAGRAPLRRSHLLPECVLLPWIDKLISPCLCDELLREWSAWWR
jgi:hypothetical protein